MCKTRKRNGFITLPYHLAPSYLQHNPYIKEGYRGNLTPSDCFRSIFHWTNETLNIWSHLFGFLVFLGLLIYDITVVYHIYPSTGTDVLVASFVLICFMLCMLLSTVYHTFNCLSEEISCKWLSWDIFGIATSFLAIFLSGIYYGFWCSEFSHLRYIYSGLVCVLFGAAMVFILVPRLMTREWDWARTSLFICWSASGLLPTIHWTILHWGSSKAIVGVFLPRIFIMYGISGVALFVYIYKIPERFRPGRFDFLGASHQIWHIVIFIALVHWYQSILVYRNLIILDGCGDALNITVS